MCPDDGAFSQEYFVYFKKKRLDQGANYPADAAAVLCGVDSKKKKPHGLVVHTANTHHGPSARQRELTTPIKQNSDCVHHKSPLLYENKSNSNKIDLLCGGQVSSLSSISFPSMARIYHSKIHLSIALIR